VILTDLGDDPVAEAFASSAARFYAYLRCRRFLDFIPSQAELVRLLERDPAALAALRRIDRVGGRRVNLRAALGDAQGAELRARLRVLSRAPRVVPAAGARREAGRILSQRRYRGSSVPRPFHRVLQWLADHLGFVGRWFDAVADRVGGQTILWTILAAVVVALAAVVARRLAARRAALVAARVDTRGARAPSPRELEREADAAERRGDLELAVRLRFRAGLLRLARAEVVPPRPSVTTAEVRRVLRLSEFDRVARDFDEIVYGRRPARAEDVETARRVWPLVVERARA
jgi:hypothetical protein